MYDAESYEIPDSDAKVYMTLDDIIRLEGIVAPGPGSVRSHHSRYSNKSNKSYRSTYSNKSNRSRRSNYSNRSRHSNYSNKSRHSNYSIKSRHSNYSNRSHHSVHTNGVRVLSESAAGARGPGVGIKRFDSTPNVNVGHSDVYSQNNRTWPYFNYRGMVKNAVKTLTGRVSKSRPQGVQKFGNFQRFKPYYRHQNFNRRNQFYTPSDLTVEIPNIRQLPPLTQATVARFNKLNNGNHTRPTYHNFTLRSRNYYPRRHSVRASLKKHLQIAIRQCQSNFMSKSNDNSSANMEFSPTPHATGQLVNDRFSSYD